MSATATNHSKRALKIIIYMLRNNIVANVKEV